MLPPEILDYIFSFLRSDPSSLKTCSDADRFLSRIAERHLYRSITVSSRKYPNFYTHSQLSQLYSDKPHIVKYIRNLRIEVKIEGLNKGHIELASLLRKIPSLQRITLASSSIINIDWNNVQEALRAAFLLCLVFPTIREAFIKRITNVPCHVLEACYSHKSLRILSLVGLHSNSGPPAESSCSTGRRLEFLSFRLCCGITKSLSGLAFTRLKALEFQPYYRKDFEALPGLLQPCSKTLTDLKLSFVDCLAINIPFNLSALSCLKRLTIHADTNVMQSMGRSQSFVLCWSPLPSIIQLIGTAPPSLKIVVLRLRIILDEKTIPSVIWSPLTHLARHRVVHIAFNLRLTKGNALVPLDLAIASIKEVPDLLERIRMGSLVISEDLNISLAEPF